jgi:Rrf2 family protein
MKLSTRSRYGIRLLYELALHYEKGLVLLKDISHRQDISEKYLGQLIIPLKSAGLVQSSRGAHGGYFLAKPPAKISLYDVVTVLEGSTCVVDCVADATACDRIEKCPTRGVWETLDKTIRDYLSGINLEDLVLQNCSDDTANLNYNI